MSSTLDEAAEDTPRKGKSNAILTYEKLSEFDLKLTRVDAKLDSLVAQHSEAAEKHQDHEIRIRALELASAALTATRSTAVGLGQWVWGAVFTLIMAALAFANYLAK